MPGTPGPGNGVGWRPGPCRGASFLEALERRPPCFSLLNPTAASSSETEKTQARRRNCVQMETEEETPGGAAARAACIPRKRLRQEGLSAWSRPPAPREGRRRLPGVQASSSCGQLGCDSFERLLDPDHPVALPFGQTRLGFCSKKQNLATLPESVSCP